MTGIEDKKSTVSESETVLFYFGQTPPAAFGMSLSAPESIASLHEGGAPQGRRESSIHNLFHFFIYSLAYGGEILIYVHI